jgi:hypothetical protein
MFTPLAVFQGPARRRRNFASLDAIPSLAAGDPSPEKPVYTRAIIVQIETEPPSGEGNDVDVIFKRHEL